MVHENALMIKGTIVGTAVTIAYNVITREEVIKTAELAAIGATVSFVLSLIYKILTRLIEKRFKKS